MNEYGYKLSQQKEEYFSDKELFNFHMR